MTQPDTSTIELKPCPFCGNHDLSYYKLDYMGDKWCIRCNDSACYVKPFATFDTDFNKSARLWNTRHG